MPVDSAILDRLSKLLKHQLSAKAIGSLAEAEAFASKIQQLLNQHKLSMSDIEAKQEEEEGVGEIAVGPGDLAMDGKRSRIHDKKTNITWLFTLAHATGECNDCATIIRPTYVKVEPWYARQQIKKKLKEAESLRRLAKAIGRSDAAARAVENEIKLLQSNLVEVSSNTYLFIGVENDRRAASDLYRYMASLCWHLAVKEGKEQAEELRNKAYDQGRGFSSVVHDFRHAFAKGFAEAVAKRLKEQRKSMLNKAAKAPENLCTALVTVDRRKGMVDAWKSSNTEAYYRTTYGAGNDNLGYELGLETGNEVPLSGKVVDQ
jgi:hypothetical protein